LKHGFSAGETLPNQLSEQHPREQGLKLDPEFKNFMGGMLFQSNIQENKD